MPVFQDEDSSEQIAAVCKPRVTTRVFFTVLTILSSLLSSGSDFANARRREKFKLVRKGGEKRARKTRPRPTIRERLARNYARARRTAFAAEKPNERRARSVDQVKN